LKVAFAQADWFKLMYPGGRMPKDDRERQFLGFLGVGMDNDDGEKRITRSEHFFLVGGSAETHERMQDTAIRFGEKLKDRGKTLRETVAEEAIDLLRESLED
jgi:hypothetical protein